MDRELLKAELKAFARSAGLDLIGVASAEPFGPERERLQRRQEAGLGPNPFEHPVIEPRVEPELLLPGARSIIAAGISYLMEEQPADPAPALRGWLSRYCRGEDYHRLLHRRLTAVAAWLQERAPGTRIQVHVDTGPPLDRAVAERAGIGKFGKHTNLITPQYGTWVFLGEILTDLQLPPDEPVEAACGSCTLCLEACPTGCITEWNLEANRCLSYVTQMKGIIPTEFREVMGNRLFGCDDCQDVCPYNRRAKKGLHPEFAPVPELGAEPDLLQLMRMTKGEFRRWFTPTAAGWRGKTTIQRNAVIALGNSGSPEALPPLQGALAAESAVLRAHAAWALGRLARQRPELAGPVQDALHGRLEAESAPQVQLEITAALESLQRRA